MKKKKISTGSRTQYKRKVEKKLGLKITYKNRM